MATTVSKTPDFQTDSLQEVMRQQIVALTAYQENRLTSNADLAIGSSSTADIRVNAAVNYVRDGIQRAQISAAEVNVPAGATMANDGTAREVVVLVYVNTSDALTALAGTIATGGATASIPLLPAGCVQIGYVRIQAAAGTAYTADSTALNAANITSTFVDCPVPSQNWQDPVRKTL